MDSNLHDMMIDALYGKLQMMLADMIILSLSTEWLRNPAIDIEMNKALVQVAQTLAALREAKTE